MAESAVDLNFNLVGLFFIKISIFQDCFVYLRRLNKLNYGIESGHTIQKFAQARVAGEP